MSSYEYFLSDLKQNCPGICVLEKEPMSKHTSFKLGGPCDYLIEPSTIEQIKLIIFLCHEYKLDYLVIGNGSDLLVSDKGLKKIVIKLGNNFSDVSLVDNLLTAQSGALNIRISNFCIENCLSGFEFASGIPGSIGGAAYMNAGAYDHSISDICKQIICLNDDGEVISLSCKDANFGYRHSIMQDKGLVILEVQLLLNPDSKQNIQDKVDDYTQSRHKSQPLNYPSAGSTFKRPDGYYAGPLIQEAGMQGVCVGGAQVSEKHAGFIINTGNASAQDVYDLIKLVQDKVYKNSGVLLQPEVKLLGF
ncbi:MAG: UDP-N-acetylmuramate dehydrogenase [Coriobacteriales bacterium]|nr:UDP-N-acetylmuramate dehydrogenase [Coriobacteriales bacterium]